jgi:hypothetical protein
MVIPLLAVTFARVQDHRDTAITVTGAAEPVENIFAVNACKFISGALRLSMFILL